MNSQPAGQPEMASKTWTFAFGVHLIILNLFLLYLLLRFWPPQVPLKGDPLWVTVIPGVWRLLGSCPTGS